MCRGYFFFLCCIISMLFFVPSNAAYVKEMPPKAVLSYHRAGLFSCFLVALGMLDIYEQGKYSGVNVDFGTSGYYYENAAGKNWWTYFFAPLNVGSKQASTVFITVNEINECARNAVTVLGRRRCKELIDKYIVIRPAITRCANRFILKHFQNKPFIGVQYRGTDKFKHESTYISTDSMCDKIASIISEKQWELMPIFVATDTEEFLQKMKNKFGTRIVSYSVLFSLGSRPVHRRENISGLRKGTEAMVDCLVLSQSNILIHTASNLATASLLFNPNLPSISVNTDLWASGLPLPKKLAISVQKRFFKKSIIHI